MNYPQFDQENKENDAQIINDQEIDNQEENDDYEEEESTITLEEIQEFRLRLEQEEKGIRLPRLSTVIYLIIIFLVVVYYGNNIVSLLSIPPEDRLAEHFLFSIAKETCSGLGSLLGTVGIAKTIRVYSDDEDCRIVALQYGISALVLLGISKILAVYMS